MDIRALAAAQGSQYTDALYTVLHEAPGTRSNLLFRGIASERAHVACSADVQVSAEARGYASAPGGGLSAMPVPSDPVGLSEILKSRLWRYLQNFANYNFQTTMFQPVGGMDAIGKAFAKELGDVFRYNAKVTRIQQSDHGVTVSYVDTTKPSTPLSIMVGTSGSSAKRFSLVTASGRS